MSGLLEGLLIAVVSFSAAAVASPRVPHLPSTRILSRDDAGVGSPTSQVDQMGISSLQEVEKAIDMETKLLDTQHQGVHTEAETAGKVLDNNIEATFKPSE